MYILNIDQLGINPEKLFKTKSGVIATWLMETCNIPLLARTSDGMFCFMKTKLLVDYIRLIPFWYNVDFAFENDDESQKKGG